MGAFSGFIQALIVLLAAIATLYYSGKAVVLHRKLLAVLHGKTGCAPVPNIGNITLHYFGGRGRAEVIRLMLKEAEIPYTEVNFSKDTWPSHKLKGTQSGLYTFGQVPAIQTSDGIKLVQSQAIAHYIGRATGMECECEDLHYCEVLALGVEDARKHVSRFMYTDFTMTERENYFKNTMHTWLGHLEKLAPPLYEQNGAYFASGRLTWVDFLIFDLLETNMEFGRYDFGGQVIEKVNVLPMFPKLHNFYRQLATRPNLAKYLHSKNRFPFKTSSKPTDLK